MTTLANLWLPILAAAAVVTVAAAVLWKVLPSAPAEGAGAGLASRLAAFFAFALAVSVLVAYVAGRTMPPAQEYFHVWRVAGTMGILAYAAGPVGAAIAGSRAWDGAWRDVAHGIVYGVLTAGAFGGFWPDA
jgi:hypothetical protein